MAFTPASGNHVESAPEDCQHERQLSVADTVWHRSKTFLVLLTIALGLALAAVFPNPLRAQSAPQITSVTPNTGKTDDSITIIGRNLGKDKVAAVFLSDAKLDHKASVVDQEPTKIIIKVPELKPGDYNISIEEGGAIYIQPVIFVVKT